MKSIIYKYLNDQASASEQKKLLDWLRDASNRNEFDQLKLSWKKDFDLQEISENERMVWDQIQTKIIRKNNQGLQKSRRLQSIFKYAAVLFFLLSIGSLTFMFLNKSQTPELTTTVMADFGQVSKVVLPDSSTVWLNSGSSITYSNVFGTKTRNIELSGEAFFDVTKNPKIPLIVGCNDFRIKVLGTKFNVDAFPEAKHINIVLEEGSVELNNAEVPSFHYKLVPGEMAEFDKEKNKLFVHNVNTSKYTSWKHGMLNIYNQPLDEVLQRLKTRYNQEFAFDEELARYRYTFTISKEPLDEIIEMMEKITPVKAVQDGNVITFKNRKNK